MEVRGEEQHQDNDYLQSLSLRNRQLLPSPTLLTPAPTPHSSTTTNLKSAPPRFVVLQVQQSMLQRKNSHHNKPKPIGESSHCTPFQNRKLEQSRSVKAKMAVQMRNRTVSCELQQTQNSWLIVREIEGKPPDKTPIKAVKPLQNQKSKVEVNISPLRGKILRHRIKRPRMEDKMRTIRSGSPKSTHNNLRIETQPATSMPSPRERKNFSTLLKGALNRWSSLPQTEPLKTEGIEGILRGSRMGIESRSRPRPHSVSRASVRQTPHKQQQTEMGVSGWEGSDQWQIYF